MRMEIQLDGQSLITNKGGTMVNHYGVQVDVDKLITGVFQMNNLEFIDEDAWAGIDMAMEEHLETCEDYKEKGYCNCGQVDADTHLIGFTKDDQGFFNPDKESEYSAIVRWDSNVVQVIRSNWGIRCALCSPCYPGQGDGDTPGEYLAYSVPPDVVGDHGNQELKKRIFLVGEEEKNGKD